MKVSQSKQSKHIFLKKLSSYFKIPFNELNENVNNYQKDTCEEIVHSDALAREFAFGNYFYCVAVDTITLDDLLFFEKFKKTQVYEEYMKGIEFLDVPFRRGYVMLLWTKNFAWCVYEEKQEYITPFDGMICLTGDKGTKFIIEPLAGFLKSKFKLPEMI